MQVIRRTSAVVLARLALALTALAAVPAWATTFNLAPVEEGQPPSRVVGTVEYYTTQYEDTFTDIARRYSLGWEEMIRANPGIDPWVPGAGKQLLIPSRRILPDVPQEGIVVNLPEHRLYYFPKTKKKSDPRIVITYPVSIAKMDWNTPLGETKVVGKEKNPSWYPPESVRKEHRERGEILPAVVGPGPDNPLGAFKMRLGITPGAYLIHGTNNPLAVGMAVTHGCMRMYPEDIEALFGAVPVGTKVRIINEPIKTAFVDGELLLEAHLPVDKEGQTYEPDLEQFAQQLDKVLGPTTAAVHWDFAKQTLQTANGLPTVVGLEADLDPPLEGEGQPAEVAGTTAPEGQSPEAGSPTAEVPAAAATAVQPANVLSAAPAHIAAAPPVAPATAPATEDHPVTSLPAPLPPSDARAAAPANSNGTRAYGAGDPEAVTARPAEPGRPSP